MATQSVGIQISQNQLNSLQNMLSDIRNGAEKAIKLAINTTIQTTKVQIAKRLGEKINLKASRIKEDIQPDKATTTKLSGAIVVRGDPVGLINFAGAQLKQGVKVKVYKDGASKLIKHAFKSTKSGKEHLWWREWRGTRKATIPNFKYGKLPKKFRLPVKRLTSIRIEDVLAKPEILDPINRDAASLFVENTDKAIIEIIRRNNVGV